MCTVVFWKLERHGQTGQGHGENRLTGLTRIVQHGRSLVLWSPGTALATELELPVRKPLESEMFRSEMEMFQAKMI